MNENKRLYRRKDGALASMSLEGGCWRLRTEDGRFTGYRLDGYDEIRDEDAANEEMEVLSCDYAIIKRQIWNLEGKVKGERARETMAKRDEVLSALYRRLDTVLSRMKMIIEVFWKALRIPAQRTEWAHRRDPRGPSGAAEGRAESCLPNSREPYNT